MNFFTSTFNKAVRPGLALKVYFFFVLLFVLSVSAINFFIDPEKIYFKKYLMERNLNHFVTSLVDSKHGVIYSKAERVFKFELANISEAECFVLGSSRSMQVSLRHDNWLTKRCASLANLSVSSASLEDILIFLSVIEDKTDKSIFISIDPWGMEFNTHSAWMVHQNAYVDYMEDMGFKVTKEESFTVMKIFNLFNYEYLLRSYRLVVQKGFSAFPDLGYKPVDYAPRFDTDIGYKEAVTLPDGSHVYSKSFISGSQDRDIDDGGYKSGNIVVNDKALVVLDKAIDRTESNSNDVMIILSPYHPYVFKEGNEEIYKKILSVEEKVKAFAAENGIEIIGGYNPSQSHCSHDEFFDSIHPMFSCISKLGSKGP